MRRFLAPILLLTLLFPSLAYGVTMKDLVITNGLYFKKFTDVPFTEKVTGKSRVHLETVRNTVCGSNSAKTDS
jgi:hypothetical protein